MQEYNPNDPDTDFAYGHNVSSGGDETSNNIAAGYWFGIFYVLFYLSDTFTNVPYEALGPEMHPDPDVRPSTICPCARNKTCLSVLPAAGASAPTVYELIH